MDTLVGDSGANVINGYQSASAAETFSINDSIDGGDGNDTLILVSDEGAAAHAATLTSVENIIYRATAAGGDISLANYASVTSLTMDRTVGATNVAGVATTDTLVFLNSPTGMDTSVTYGGTLTGSSDSAAVTLNGVINTGNNTDIAFVGAVEAMTINTTGAASSVEDLDFDAGTTSVTINADEALTVVNQITNAAVTTWTVTGDSLVTLTPAVGAAVTTITSAAQTAGGLVATGVAATTAMTGGAGADNFTSAATTTVINAGAGNDTVTVSGVTTVAVDGGEGDDTLKLTNGNQLTAATAALIANFEKLSITTAAANAFDAGLETSLGDLSVAFSGANDATVTNAKDGLNITVTNDANTQNLVVGIKDATNPGTANTATLTLDHATASTDVDIGGVDMAGLETLNIVSTGVTGAAAAGTTNSVADVDGSTALRTINISGDAHFTLTDVGANNTVLEMINGTDATGVLTIAVSNGGSAAGVAINGGSNNDSLTGDDGTDIISGGAGNDTIDGADGIDQITTGAGTDNVVIATEATLAAMLASRDIITDFTVGTDNVDYNGATANITTLTGSAAFGAATSVATHSTSGNLVVSAVEKVVKITVESASTLSTDGASVLNALVSGAASGSITTQADAVVLFLVDNGTNTGLYVGASDVAGGGNTAMVASEIALIGTFNGVLTSAFTAGDFM